MVKASQSTTTSRFDSKEATVRHPHVLAGAALMCAGLLGAGCGSGANSSASGYPAASGTATQSAASTGAAAGYAAPSGAADAASAATTVSTVHTALGTVLVAGPKRLTVYLFAADKGSKSSCSGECAQVWPPVTTKGSPRASGGALASDLGTTSRAGGVKQLTYKGHPLYYYVGDQRSGTSTGEGIDSFGAAWYVLSPTGKAIMR
jgi:predicted lipoprotein with Yx(FWY)xxD motif